MVTNEARADTGRAPYIHRTQRGELRIWLPAPTVVLVEYVGHADASFVDFIASVFGGTVGSRRGVHLYIDTEEQTGHDAAFRDRIVEWAKSVEVETTCILVRSRIVAFGVTVANMLVGGHKTMMTSPEAFRAQLDISVRDSLQKASR
jgi:hypothetical protein